MKLAQIAVAVFSLILSSATATATTVQVTIANADSGDDVYVKVMDLNSSPNMIVYPDPASGAVCAPLAHGGGSATFNATALADGKYNLRWVTVDTSKQQTKAGSCNDAPGSACQVDLFSPSPVDPSAPPCP